MNCKEESSESTLGPEDSFGGVFATNSLTSSRGKRKSLVLHYSGVEKGGGLLIPRVLLSFRLSLRYCNKEGDYTP